MAAPACRSRQTTSSFPNLAALINSVSSFSCQNRTYKLKSLLNEYSVRFILYHNWNKFKIELFPWNLFSMTKDSSPKTIPESQRYSRQLYVLLSNIKMKRNDSKIQIPSFKYNKIILIEIVLKICQLNMQEELYTITYPVFLLQIF